MHPFPGRFSTVLTSGVVGGAYWEWFWPGLVRLVTLMNGRAGEAEEGIREALRTIDRTNVSRDNRVI